MCSFKRSAMPAEGEDRPAERSSGPRVLHVQHGGRRLQALASARTWPRVRMPPRSRTLLSPGRCGLVHEGRARRVTRLQSASRHFPPPTNNLFAHDAPLPGFSVSFSLFFYYHCAHSLHLLTSPASAASPETSGVSWARAFVAEPPELPPTSCRWPALGRSGCDGPEHPHPRVMGHPAHLASVRGLRGGGWCVGCSVMTRTR